MPLIQLQHVDYSVGGPLLLHNVDLNIEANERVCVVGRNGEGKSTLLRLIAGEIRPDDGEIRVEKGTRIARLAQEVPQDTRGTIFDVVAAGIGDVGALLARYHHLSGGEDLDELARVQSAIEAQDGWALDRRVALVLTRLDLPADVEFAALSGGMKRRVLLAQALVREPDLLLLDEPTNHLDIEAIAWLEEFLRGFGGSIVFVTHDRAFLRALATRIVEIDRGQITSWPGDYDNYLRRKEERLHAESQANLLFDKKLAQEEVWIRQGIKARRTRNEGRVRALESMRRERAQRRAASGTAKITLGGAQSSGRKVIEARDVDFAYGARAMVKDFSTTIVRGDRVGIVGPNGSGKTTLLKLMLQELAPQHGRVELGTHLQIAYFDQHRAVLREDLNALDNVAGGLEYIELDGSLRHVLGYLQDFLFSAERARSPITRLSGGERNRLLLAKLFARPSNLLVMDEPTNDLDIETLELLEELLGSYKGTLLLVSHDRDFIDNVVTSTLVLEGGGRVGEYVGGYSDWLRQKHSSSGCDENVAKPTSSPSVGTIQRSTAPTPATKAKLSFKETRELDELPSRIDQLEQAIAARTLAMQQPDFYKRDPAAITAANAEISALQSDLDAAYLRWQQLERT